jgi:hypothetical protein
MAATSRKRKAAVCIRRTATRQVRRGFGNFLQSASTERAGGAGRRDLPTASIQAADSVISEYCPDRMARGSGLKRRPQTKKPAG